MPEFDAATPDHAVEDSPDSESGEWRDVADVGTEVARDAWAEAARKVLLDAAARYRTVVSYKELASEVQERTGIRTRQLTHYWVGDVLGRVSAACAQRGEPLLSSLCVNTAGSVGAGYAVAVRAAFGDTPVDPDDHAARERLECHRFFQAADLPPGGGTPALTPKLAATRDRARKVRLSERTVATCPGCHMELPATGTCNYCD